MNIDDPQLDARLDTASAALSTALDKVLDLDAGLADARLPSRRAQLTQALDGILDLDAGLRQIMPTSAAVPQSSLRAGPEPAHSNPLLKFAVWFAARPVHERLTARTWFPMDDLAAARTAEALKIGVQSVSLALQLAFDLHHARARDLNLARIRTLAHDLTYTVARTSDRDRAVKLTVKLARDLARDLARFRIPGRIHRAYKRALKLAEDLAQDLVLDPALDVDHHLDPDVDHNLALDVDHNLAQSVALVCKFARIFDSAGFMELDVLYLVPEYQRAFAHAHAHAHSVVHAIVRDRGRHLIRALTVACDVDLDLAHALVLALRGVAHQGFDRWLIGALDELDAALSNMVACDLTDVDLRGIPLDGVRWSPTTTRWPREWAEHIRHNSIQIDVDLYEIRPGTATHQHHHIGTT
ncbi:hypothetical protein ACIRG5_45580 [Lentzea sp. NPDC102401]|uniref:hypothetical protein n=1 Tax=Lentzea sp. NPDC102401 TaxID=3364128 RepID=UPI00381DFF7E